MLRAPASHRPAPFSPLRPLLSGARRRALAAGFGILALVGGMGGGGAVAQTPEATRSLAGAYLAAEHARNEGALDLASRYFDRAMAFSRNDPILAHRAFLMALSTGRIDRAISLADRVRQSDPESQLALMVTAIAAVRDGDPDAALADINQMEEAGIGQYMVPLMRAWVLAATGDRSAAEQALSAFDDVPDFANLVAYHRGLLALAFEDLDGALTAFAKVADSRPSIRETLVIGTTRHAAGDIEGARDLYQTLLDIAPDLTTLLDARAALGGAPPETLPIPDAQAGLAEALFHLASLFGGQDANEIALFYARMAESLRPDAPHIVHEVGNILTDMGLSAAAIDVLESLDPTTGDGWSAHYLATRLYAQLDELDAAAESAQRLIDLRPGLGGAGILLGDVLRYRGDYEGAVTAYREAAERSDEPLDGRWRYIFKLAMALERVGAFDEAEPLFRQALALQPNDANLLNYLGYSLIDRGMKLEEAEAMIRQAVALEPTSGFIVDSLGWAHFRLGRYDEAVDELERAVELEPADPVILDHLGDAYWVVGREREARYRWRDALRVAGDDTDLILAIERKLAEGLDMESLPTVPGAEDTAAGAQEAVTTP